MKKVLRIILLIANIISFAFVLFFGTTGIICELFGPATYEKFLAKLSITWSFEHILLFAYGCLIITIITYILRKKFF